MGQHLSPTALIFITLLFIQPYSVASSNKYAKIIPEKVINSFFWPENGETSFKNSPNRFSKCLLEGCVYLAMGHSSTKATKVHSLITVGILFLPHQNTTVATLPKCPKPSLVCLQVGTLRTLP